MSPREFKQHIARTLLYYEIFDHPLTASELFFLLPCNSISRPEFIQMLHTLTTDGDVVESSGLFTLADVADDVRSLRRERERLARRRLRVAKFMTHVIKRFPFVRGVFLSGDLSKGVAHHHSDIDYVIVTAQHRLWVCRILLVLFKKTLLLNSRRYFCLNYFVAENNLTLEDRNYFTATEIAHLKPLYNIELFLRYMNANRWVKEYFPNFKVFAFTGDEGNNHASMLQKVLELPFTGTWVNRFDRAIMEKMKSIWARRYPQYDTQTRERIFRCTPTESCAYVGNFSDKILGMYNERLSRHQLTPANHE